MREKSQEQFEEWARHDRDWEDDDFRLINGVYYWGTTREAFLAWQASREALVIELPEVYAWDNDGGFEKEYDPDSECSMALIPKIDVIIAIEAAGVKVKV